MVLEYLVCLTRQGVKDRSLEVYVNGGVEVEPIIAFIRALFKSFLAINSIMADFYSFFGLVVNSTKSHVIFSKRVDDHDHLSTLLGYQARDLPIKYLGIPLTRCSISHKDCATLLVDLKDILDCWSGCRLSYAGRI